jgi:hypothetical protein
MPKEVDMSKREPDVMLFVDDEKRPHGIKIVGWAFNNEDNGKSYLSAVLHKDIEQGTLVKAWSLSNLRRHYK